MMDDSNQYKISGRGAVLKEEFEKKEREDGLKLIEQGLIKIMGPVKVLRVDDSKYGQVKIFIEMAETKPGEPPYEGWGDMQPGKRVFHYYQGVISLCKREKNYSGRDLIPDRGRDHENDCKACSNILRRIR